MSLVEEKDAEYEESKQNWHKPAQVHGQEAAYEPYKKQLGDFTFVGEEKSQANKTPILRSIDDIEAKLKEELGEKTY